jgi:hypothetical protein
VKQPQRPHLVGAAGIGLGQVLGDVERRLQVLAVDDIEAEQLLFGLGVRPSSTSGGSESLRRVVAAVVGISRTEGPNRPAFSRGSCTLFSADITAWSCSWLQEKTASSLL